MFMFPEKKHSVSAGFVILMVLGLSACSAQAPTYSGLSDLLDAYNAGVEECESPKPFPGNDEYGIDGVLCASRDSVIWFPDDDAKARWVALAMSAGHRDYVLGPDWMVMTSDFENVTSSMGGTAFVKTR
jgi:hypothetical protein